MARNKNGRNRVRTSRLLRLETLENRRMLAGDVPDGAGLEPLDLTRFESTDQLEEFLIEDALERYEGLFGQPGWWGPLYRTLDGFPEADLATPAAGGAAVDYSDTNTQVAGVDEGDIVETDGRYLYIVSGQEVVIASASPSDQLQVASRVQIDGQPFAEFLAGDRLTVLSHSFDHFGYPEPWLGGPMIEPFVDVAYPGWMYQPSLTVTVLDVSSRTAPKLVQQTEVEGSYIDSRAIGDMVHVVTNANFGLPTPELHCGAIGDDKGDEPPPPDGRLAADMIWYPPNTNCVYETREEFLQRVEGQVLEMGLPEFSSIGPDGDVAKEGLLSQATDIYRPISPDETNLVSVVTFDMAADQPGPVDSISVPATYAAEVYASTDSLYVTNPRWGWAEDAHESASILKFDLDHTTGEVDLTATGRVPGRTLNSFSMDEHEGYLRVATTEGFGENSQNQIFVMQQSGDKLEIVGQTDVLAPGEQIYSVRFMGDRAYVVTFLRVDPLFALDMSNPTDPQVLGELKITGFSNYLHPIGENYLIGLGNDANEETGRVEELQVSLFYTPDSGTPELVDRYSFALPDWAWTEANHDHHAFALYPHPDQAEDRVLAIPVTSGNDLVSVDRDGDGRMDVSTYRPRTHLWTFHIDLPADGVPPDGKGADRSGIGLIGQIEHEAQVRRSVRIGRDLFAISDSLVTAHDMLDPKVELGRLHFGQEDVGIPVFEADERLQSVGNAIEMPQRNAPQVLDVVVGSTTWSHEFVNSLDQQDNDAQPLEVLPFRGVDQIKVTFSEDVVVGWNDMSLVGSDRSTHAVREFSYDPDIATAVWTLSEVLEADTVNLSLRGVVDLSGAALDGDADGRAGGSFAQPLSVLPGDVNRDGLVDRVDLIEAMVAPPAQLGDPAYDLLRDVDGNGRIDESDFGEVERRAGTALPSEPTARPNRGDVNGDGRFDQRDIVQVLQGGKYLTDLPATWSDGDWTGDGRVNQLDIVAALQDGAYTSDLKRTAIDEIEVVEFLFDRGSTG